MNPQNDIVFSPAFGNRPTSLVGRQAIVDSFISGLDSKPGSKERSAVFLGKRGYGKTVLLWELADRAREAGFAVATPTSVREGLVRRVAEKLEDDADRIAGARKPTITGGSIGALGFSAGVQFSHTKPSRESDEARLTRVCRTLSERGTGALLLVDELQANSPEVRNLVGTYQELIGERLNVALAVAGLPASVSRVLNDRVLTFLNRARKIELGGLTVGDIDAFFATSLKKCGVKITKELRKQAAEATEGSPYLMQLVGHYIVLYADDDGTIHAEGVESAVTTAREEYRNDVCSTTLAPLSNTDIKYLCAMAAIGDPCKSSAVAAEMGVSIDYAQQYRRRMIEAGIIQSPRQGIVEFAVPLLADYLRDRHIAL